MNYKGIRYEKYKVGTLCKIRQIDGKIWQLNFRCEKRSRTTRQQNNKCSLSYMPHNHCDVLSVSSKGHMSKRLSNLTKNISKSNYTKNASKGNLAKTPSKSNSTKSNFKGTLTKITSTSLHQLPNKKVNWGNNSVDKLQRPANYPQNKCRVNSEYGWIRSNQEWHWMASDDVIRRFR
jgi:hypothetical protein